MRLFVWATVMMLAACALSPVRAQEAAVAPASSVPLTWKIPSNDDIRKLLAERMRHNGVGTVVSVVEPAGKRVVAFGRSGAPDGRPLDGDTVFQIGSVSKVFVGLLLADMVRRGEVALDDPAQKFLPAGVRMPERGRPITLIDLSTHHSGLPSMPNNFRLEAEPNPVEAYSVDDLWQFLSSYQLTRAPGQQYEYSNLAVALLGRVLALHDGKDYETVLKERVLEPLGMRSTAITLNQEMQARVAPGHSPYLQPVYVWEMKTIQASGSLRSSANDLMRFIAAYVDSPGTRLDESMALQLRTRSPVTEWMSLGWSVDTIGGREIYAHEGGKSGYRCAVAFDLRTRTGVVVLQNARTDDRPTPIANYLLTGQTLPPARDAPAAKPVVQVAPNVLDRYAGRYSAKHGIVRVVSKADHLLVSYGAGDAGLEFIPTGPREFFFNAGNDDIAFELDGKGAVSGMRIYPDGKAMGTSELAPRVAETEVTLNARSSPGDRDR